MEFEKDKLPAYMKRAYRHFERDINRINEKIEEEEEEKYMWKSDLFLKGEKYINNEEFVNRRKRIVKGKNRKIKNLKRKLERIKNTKEEFETAWMKKINGGD